MKKDTVSGWIHRQRDLISRKEHNATLRKTKLVALKQCEDWLFALTWAQMRAPVKAKREAIRAGVLPLLEKQKREPLASAETLRLDELSASDEIYALFEAKVTPTAVRAEVEQRQRQREQARRVVVRQERKR